MDTKQFLKEVAEAVENNTFYDYVANNYYKLDKEQLKEIILNLDFAATVEAPSNTIDIEYKMLEELERRLQD